MIAALILAGGKGTRLGGVDKAFLRLSGTPLIEHLLDRLAPQAADIAISANGDPARFARYNRPVLSDLLHGKGPLAGIASGLAWAKDIGADALLSVPVDTAFIPHDLIAQLAPGPSVAAFASRQHHLVALWPTAFLPELETFLDKPGDYKVREALALVSARLVAFAGPSDPFLNINTPEDYAEAANLATRKASSYLF